MLFAFFDAPEFLTIERVVRIRGFRTETDEFPTTVNQRDVWRSKSLAKIAVRGDLAVRFDVTKIYRAVGSPDGFPSALIESDDELLIAAVKIHDKQIAKKNRRRSRAAKMIALDVAPLPQNIERVCIDACGAGRAERHIDAPFFNDRSRGSVGVEWMSILGVFNIEKFQVADDAARVRVKTKRVQCVTIPGRSRQPDLLAKNYRRRPAAIMNCCLPDDIPCLAPVKRQITCIRMTIPFRPAKLQPIVICLNKAGER